MAGGPGWQPRYMDLSDGKIVRFGVVCAVCSAQYASVGESVQATGRRPARRGDAPGDEQKNKHFAAFAVDVRAISFPCPSCRRLACPECWDAAHGLCGACAADAGYPIAPRIRLARDNPLVTGRLVRFKLGTSVNANPPGWLNDLVASGQQRDAQRSGRMPAARAGRKAPPPMSPLPDLAADGPGAPTMNTARAPRTLAGAFRQGVRRVRGNTAAPRGRPGPAARAPGMVICPRCGAQNPDFVTTCSQCQLQLVMICPVCEGLNPGDAEVCLHCGAELDGDQKRITMKRPATIFTPEEVVRKTYRLAEGEVLEEAAVMSPPRRRVFSGRLGRQRISASAQMMAAEPPGMAAALGDQYAGSGAVALAERDYPLEPPWHRRLLAFLDVLLLSVLRFILMVVLPLVVAVVAAAQLALPVNDWLRNALHLDVRAIIQQILLVLSVFWSSRHL